MLYYTKPTTEVSIMKINDKILKNDVSAQNQTRKKVHLVESNNPAARRVLFFGNSITLHAPKPDIGWNHNWGMAASAEEKDYVHLVVKGLRERYGDIAYTIASVGDFERGYWKEDALTPFKGVKDFHADTVIFRFGENIRREDLESHPLFEHLKAFVEYFAQEVKKVVVTDCFWEYESVGNAFKTLAKENGYEFVPLSDLGYQDENMAIGLFEHKGVAMHPGDLGMQRIAERILEKL